MKRIYTILMVVILPLFAHAGLLSRVQQLGNKLPKSPSRDFRLSEQIVSYSDDGTWTTTAKTMLHYSNIHPAQVDSLTTYNWDGESWGSPAGFTYNEYNAAGLLTSSIMMMDNGVEMIGFIRTESFYDAQNRISHYNMFVIDFLDFQTWNPAGRFHFVYGANTEFEIFMWDQDEGDDLYSHSTFDYDSSGRIIQEYSYESPDSTNWVLDSKNEIGYHPQDNSTGADFINYLANAFGSNLFLMNWDMPILRQSDTSYLHEADGWTPDYRTLWEYDGSLRQIRQDDEDWAGGQWVANYRTSFYYDTNGNLSSSIEQSDYGDVLVDETKTEFFWEGFTSSEDLVQDVSPALQIQAWPLPFSESLNISTTAKSGAIPHISIYNSRGQLIREFTGSDKLTWDGKDSKGRDSANGIYFIRAKQDKASAVSKVIRVK